MLIEFHKMHGLGNDFVIFKDTVGFDELSFDTVKFLCDRKIGIGCDQLIICKEIKENELKYVKMKVYNANGKIAGFCGNATRCVAGLYLDESQNENKITILTGNGFLSCSRNESLITVNLGPPVLDWDKIPLSMPIQDNQLELPHEIKINSEALTGYCLNVGNPHIVLFVQNHDFNMADIGSKIENSEYFPQKVNVNFARIIDRKTINLSVWERGSGLTLACGSGACASFYAAYKNNLVDNDVNIIFPIGFLNIKLDNNDILMTGGYTHVYNGKVEINF